jgi:hypothetical protein
LEEAPDPLQITVGDGPDDLVSDDLIKGGRSWPWRLPRCKRPPSLVVKRNFNTVC